jgi:hypothetical protein
MNAVFPKVCTPIIKWDRGMRLGLSCVNHKIVQNLDFMCFRKVWLAPQLLDFTYFCIE